MHTIHWCTWKSLQFFIIIIMMAWFMRAFQQNALAPSSLYSILPQCIRPHFLSCICVFSFLFTAIHVKSLAFCVWEWRRYSIQYKLWRIGQVQIGNRFHVTLRILGPKIWKKCLRLKCWRGKACVEICQFLSQRENVFFAATLKYLGPQICCVF